MGIVTVEINDNLEQIVNDTVEELVDVAKEVWVDYLQFDNNEILDHLTDHGDVHDRIDSAVPIYTSDIRDLYYFHRDLFEGAYQDHGIGDGSEDNHESLAIYCYLSDEVVNRLAGNLQNIYDELLEIDDEEEQKKFIENFDLSA